MASTTPDTVLDTRAERRGRMGWYCYDWANSVFTTSVTSVFFGPFLTEITQAAADPAGFVDVLGIGVRAEAYYPFLVGLAVALQVFLLPVLAGIAARRDKGPVVAMLAAIGGLATVAMLGIPPGGFLLGGVLFVVATMALGGSVTVYDAYLPALAPPHKQDRLSTQGSAAGYLSGGIVLVVSLGLLVGHEAVGLTEDQAVRINFALAGVWWLGFGMLAVWLLRGLGSPARAGADPSTSGFASMWAAVRGLRQYPGAALFLLGFLFYNNGVVAVSSLVTTFATGELGVSEDVVIVIALVLQIVAVGGAIATGRLAERFGGRPVLLVFVLIWAVLIVMTAVLPVGAVAGLFALSVATGVVLGGTYGLSRSVFLRLVPTGGAAVYLGLFEVVNRCLGFLAPVTFGLALQLSGSYRVALTSLAVFMLAGAVPLMSRSVRRATRPNSLM